MNLYLLTQQERLSYDTFDSFIACASSAKEAINMTPDGEEWGSIMRTWASSPDKVDVKYIGKAAMNLKKGVVLASFNAG